MKVVGFLVLCVVAVGAGLGWGVYDYSKATGTPVSQVVGSVEDAAAKLRDKDKKEDPKDVAAKTPEDPVEKKDPPPRDTTKPPVVPDKDAVKPPVDPVTPKVPETELAKLVAEGERLYQDAKFALAKKKFLQALSGSLSPAEDARVRGLQVNATLFQGLIDQINPQDILPLDRRAVIFLQNGGRIDGVLEKEEDGWIHIRKDNGISAKYKDIQVLRLEKKTKEDMLKILEGEYALRLLELKKNGTALDWYELAIFCVKNQLEGRVTMLLEKAVTENRNVLEMSIESKAKMLYDQYIYFEKRGKNDIAGQKRAELIAKFPNSRYAAQAKGRPLVAVVDKPPVNPPVDPPVDPKDPPVDPKDPPVDPKDPPVGPKDPPAEGAAPSFGNAKVADLVRKGNVAYDEAMIHLEKSFDDSEKDPDGENLKALNKFKEACAAYEAAVEIEPNNAWLNDRLQRAGENRVMCFIAAKTRR